MKKSILLLIVILMVVLSFLLGKWYSHGGGQQGAGSGKKILHYVDPMHPSYTSDKPGIAPDCGMPLEPVYADGTTGETKKGNVGMPPGTVQVTPERQQLIGVRTAMVGAAPGSRTLRFVGRVAPDETRLYVINATIDGWITKVSQVTTGSIVREEEVLATFYSPEFLSASSSLLFALSSMDRVQNAGGGAPQGQVQKDQMAQFNVNLQQYKDSLRNLGMGRRQVEDMIKSRKFTESIDITSPGYGVVLTRNVSDGQRFAKGEQFFKIADLRRVWVLMDVYENEADLFRPGMKVKVALPQRQRTFTGTVSPVPPIFDPASRTLKVRLYVDNPGMVLRPDMFVDVEAPVTLPAAISVPVEAVLDSGLKKTVFVDRGNGYFEPRAVETGRSLGDRVEVIRGLMSGERVVVSGNFLIDSETRMQQAAAGITGKAGTDPVCGMYLDEDRARAAGNSREYQGKSYFFCSPECRDKFAKDPAKHASSAAPLSGSMPMAKDPATPRAKAKADAVATPMPAGAAGSHDHSSHPTPGAKPHD